MNEIRLIDEGNDEDFGVAEYDFGARPQSAWAPADSGSLEARGSAFLSEGGQCSQFSLFVDICRMTWG